MERTGTQTEPATQLTITVDAQRAGQRLDRYLAAELAGLSRSHVKRLVLEGRVKVGGRPARPSHEVRPGEVVEVELPPPAPPPQPVPEAIPLTVVYEDGDVAVVDKPAGIAVHPGAGRTRGTLVNALLATVGTLSRLDPLRPGIVHRLDKDTSGLMVVAKTDEAHAALADQIRRRAVQRWYLALVRGQPAWNQRRVEAPIGRHPVHRRRMVVRPGGREATTDFAVRERLGAYTLVEAKLHTGRTHQIRVHARYLGHPVAGDPVYGRRGELGLSRQFLHAWRLAFTHPRTGAPLEFRSPLPEDLREVLDALRRTHGGGRVEP
ncbi:Ribosomal large subunit pseudouridine synthase D [bacterium HR32]|nr:Ribosomal large subunit pseudouridine synthase D [bacterium HR32]